MKMPKQSISMLVWISENRGILTKIAGTAKVSPQFVHMVLHGQRSNALVEKLLRERGAPIVDRADRDQVELEPTAA